LIHRRLFRSAASPCLVSQYLQAHQVLGCLNEMTPLPGWTALVRRGGDLHSLELFLRRRDRFNPVTMKFHLVCYLAEVKRSHLRLFVKLEPGVLGPAFWLALQLIVTPWSYVKGALIAWRSGLV
jgi:hypothetical protein